MSGERPKFRPTNLHVGHSWGGGLGKFVDDFARGDQYSNGLILRGHGTWSALGLVYKLTTASGELVEQWVPDHPVAATAISNGEYASRLAAVIDRHSIDHLYVSSLIGHSLDVLDTGVPTTLIFHNYQPFCAAINPYFGEVCQSCGADRLTACLVDNPRSARMRMNDANHWRRTRDTFIDRLLVGDVSLVSPSHELVRHLTILDPRFGDLDFEIIPHGVDTPALDCFGGGDDGRRLRILLLGSLKGAEMMIEAFSELQVIGDLFLIGSGPEAPDYSDRTGVTVVEHYDNDRLGEILSDVHPDLALFTALAPETFSYALSEAWIHGLPVVTPDRGGFLERVSPGETGWLYSDRKSMVHRLLKLDEDRALLREVHDNVLTLPRRSVSDMVDDYYALRPDYTDLVARRLVMG